MTAKSERIRGDFIGWVFGYRALGCIAADHEAQAVQFADSIVPALIHAAAADDTDLVCSACMGLESFGHGALNAVPFLLELLQHADEQVRYQATWALAEIAPRMVIPELVRILHRHHPNLKFQRSIVGFRNRIDHLCLFATNNAD